MTHPPRPVTSPARQPARGARLPGPQSRRVGPAPPKARSVVTAAKGRGVCGQVFAPRRTRRAGRPGCDIVQLRRCVGWRHPACVIVCDIMGDWPPARPLPEPDAAVRCLGTCACSGDSPPAAPRTSGEQSTAQGVSHLGTGTGPHRTAQPRGDQRTGWCFPADHFLWKPAGACSLEEGPGGVGPGRRGCPRTPSDPSSQQGTGIYLLPKDILLEARFLTYAYCHGILTATPREKRSLFLLHSKARWVAQVHTANKGWCI